VSGLSYARKPASFSKYTISSLGLVSWDAARRKITWSKFFRFELVLFLLPYAAVALMILSFPAAYFRGVFRLTSLSNLFFYWLFPTIPSLSNDILLSGMHFTILILMPFAVLGPILSTPRLCPRLKASFRQIT